jgi:hypothetical protein
MLFQILGHNGGALTNSPRLVESADDHSRLFDNECSASRLSLTNLIHEAVDNGTKSPLNFFVRTSIENSEQFSTNISLILGDFEDLVRALAKNKSRFDIVQSPNEIRMAVAAERWTDCCRHPIHTGVLAVRKIVGTKLTARPEICGTLYVLCHFQPVDLDADGKNMLVFQMHSTPGWDTKTNKKTEQLTDDKYLFTKVFHIGRSKYQLRNLASLSVCENASSSADDQCPPEISDVANGESEVRVS